MTDRQRTVALLIDYDNLQICYNRDAPGTQLDLGAVMALAQSYGRVLVARAYAEWNLLSERLVVYKAGMEPAFAPVLRPEGSAREGKSLADTVMVSDGVDLLWTLQPDVLVLVTSDKDMVPLARLAKQRGALVVVLGSDLTAVQLLEMASEFVTYRHLVKELGRPDDRLPAPQVREEPRVRRGRPPVGSPEVAAAREASLREPRVLQPRTRRPRPEPGIAPGLAPSVGPEAMPPPIPLVSAEPLELGTAGQLDESGQPLAVRRRRRRGGRGRRLVLPGDQPGGANQAEDEAIGDALVGFQEELPAIAESVNEISGSVSTAADEMSPPQTVAQGPLRPWERWPQSDPGGQPAPAPAEPDAASSSANAELRPLEASAQSAEEPAATETSTNGAAPETQKGPARPRRRRVRRPAASAEAEPQSTENA